MYRRIHVPDLGPPKTVSGSKKENEGSSYPDDGSESEPMVPPGAVPILINADGIHCLKQLNPAPGPQNGGTILNVPGRSLCEP